MTAKTLQQTLSQARNANIVRIVSIGLALALLVAGALAYFSIARPSGSVRVAAPPPSALRSPASPAQLSTGSAYDGGSYGSLRAPASIQTGNPILHASNSAYDGGDYDSSLAGSPQRVRDIPALHSTGSAYDGQ